jgi:hypothetical protein
MLVTNRVKMVTFGVKESGKNMQKGEGVAAVTSLRRLDHMISLLS